MSNPKPIRAWAFSGILCSGKDFIADEAGLCKIGFADPIYQMTEYFCGTSDKSIPGVRRFMQKVGQWGWGKLDDADPDYQWTIERVLFIQKLKEIGSAVFGNGYGDVDVNQFGKIKSFWADILERRMDDLLAYRRLEARGHTGVGVVNVRFPHELELISRRGIKHYLVDCTQETQQARLKAKGAVLTQAELHDTSEHFAAELRKTLPPEQIIWNDDDYEKPHQDYLSVTEFLEQMEGCPT